MQAKIDSLSPHIIDEFIDKVGHALSNMWKPTDIATAEEFYDIVLDCRDSKNCKDKSIADGEKLPRHLLEQVF